MTKYSVEFKHDTHTVIVCLEKWEDVIDLLRKVSYIEIGMSIEVSTYREMV